MSFKKIKLFDLPVELIASILTEWLKLNEVCLLDSAMNNRKQRLELLNIMKSNITLFDGNYIKSINGNSENISWISLRKLSIKKLIINDLLYIDINDLNDIIKKSPR